MSLTEKKLQRAIAAMHRAADALSPVVASLPESTASMLYSNLREYADYLERLAANRESWLWRDGILRPKRQKGAAP